MKITGMIEVVRFNCRNKEPLNYFKKKRKKLLEGKQVLLKPLAFQKGPSLAGFPGKTDQGCWLQEHTAEAACCKQEAFFTSAQTLNLSHNWQVVTEMQVWKTGRFQKTRGSKKTALASPPSASWLEEQNRVPSIPGMKESGSGFFFLLLASAVQGDVIAGSSMG